MADDFLRQRRNLLLISVIIMFYYIGDVQVDGFMVSSAKVIVRNEVAVPILLWSLFAYFLHRYWVHYYHNENLMEYIEKKYPKENEKLLEENGKNEKFREEIRSSSLTTRLKNFFSEIPTIGLRQGLHLLYDLNDKKFSNYQIPFIIALLTSFITTVCERYYVVKIPSIILTSIILLYFKDVIFNTISQIIETNCKYIKSNNETIKQYPYLIKYFKKLCECRENITLYIVLLFLIIFFIFVVYSIFYLVFYK